MNESIEVKAKRATEGRDRSKNVIETSVVAVARILLFRGEFKINKKGS